MDTNQAPTATTSAAPEGAGPTPRRCCGLRRAATGLAVAGVLAIGAGTAVAANSDTDSAEAGATSMVEQMDQMHQSPAAQEMHAQMTPELRAQMEEMHSKMREMMGSMQSMMGTVEGTTMMDGEAMGSEAGR